MTPRDRLHLEQVARKLRAQADELMRLAPLQALRLQGVAQELELRTAKLTRCAEIGVRA